MFGDPPSAVSVNLGLFLTAVEWVPKHIDANQKLEPFDLLHGSQRSCMFRAVLLPPFVSGMM